ncbi:MAG: alkaline phosphatase family protein, partial [Anaerolineae bacterium]|nr:alkaline phosphatase family protein [Anaerolineae bacterium]
PGWVIERLLQEGKLPNVQRLIDMGVYVHNTIGEWPSLTAAGHAAVFNGAYGNVNGITGNGVPFAPFPQHTIGEGGISGYSAASLLTEPIWITAARQGLKSSLISVTQSGPFEMYTSADYVSSQGAKSFGDFSDYLTIIDGYAGLKFDPGVVRGGTGGVEISKTEATEWTNLPAGAAFRAFRLGGGRSDQVRETTLNGLIIASDGTTFDHIALSADKDYSSATILRPTPAANDASQMSDPVWLTICDQGDCGTGWTQLRLTDLAADGTSFTLWHTAGSDLTGHVTSDVDVDALRAIGGAFTGNGMSIPAPFPSAPSLPNIYGEIAFTVNEWEFSNLIAQIERNQHDLYFSYAPFPDEWHHAYYSYMDQNSPLYSPDIAARAWSYEQAIYGNLDMHLGRIMDVLDSTGRPWNIVLFTDHGFTSAWRFVYPNRILLNAGLLVLDSSGRVDPTKTKAYFGNENAGGVHINRVDGQLHGIVTADEYDAVVQQVIDALTSAVDPATQKPVISNVYRSEDFVDEGLGGANNADLYLELAYGYYWQPNRNAGRIAEAAPSFLSGVHGFRPSSTPSLQGFAVLGGANFADGVSVATANSTDLTPTAALTIGIPPADHWTGIAHKDWIAEK